MTDEPKHLDPFKPQEPTIPGVTGNPARVKAAPEPPRPLGPSYQNRPGASPLLNPGVLIAIGAAVVAAHWPDFFLAQPFDIGEEYGSARGS